MIISRALPALRAAKLLSNKAVNHSKISSIRQSHDWSYRKCSPVDPKMQFYAEIGMAYAWWWFLWHIWTEPEHIIGEFPYPDPKEWTDAELGIPS